MDGYRNDLERADFLSRSRTEIIRSWGTGDAWFPVDPHFHRLFFYQCARWNKISIVRGRFILFVSTEYHFLIIVPLTFKFCLYAFIWSEQFFFFGIFNCSLSQFEGEILFLVQKFFIPSSHRRCNWIKFNFTLWIIFYSLFESYQSILEKYKLVGSIKFFDLEFIFFFFDRKNIKKKKKKYALKYYMVRSIISRHTN